MQQLTLQFDGYADSSQPVDAGTARQCKDAGFYKAFQHFFSGLAKSVTRPSVKISLWLREESPLFSAFAGESITRIHAICGTAAVVFSFGLMSFAAIIGG